MNYCNKCTGNCISEGDARQVHEEPASEVQEGGAGDARIQHEDPRAAAGGEQEQDHAAGHGAVKEEGTHKIFLGETPYF